MKTKNPQAKRLKQIEPFSTCTTRQLRWIDSLMTTIRVEPGRVLTAEGRRGQEFMIVMHGTATASRAGRTTGRFGPGSYFGGEALLHSDEPTAMVVADTDMEILVSSAREFRSLHSLVPGLSDRLGPAQVASNPARSSLGILNRFARRTAILSSGD